MSSRRSSPRARQVVVILLLAVGVEAWLIWGGGILRSPVVALVALALSLAPLIPPVRRAIDRTLAVVRFPTPRARCVTAIAISFLAAVYLFYVAKWQGRTFLPRSHDEFMYLLQARMLSVGRLWLPAHPMGEFFDSFYVFVEPVYASLTWPGTALLLVPGVWMGWPHWLIPLILSAAAVGLMYGVVTQYVDGAAGLVAAVALVALRLFRMESIQSQAQVPMLLWGLLLAWLWLKWRRAPGPVLAALMGMAMGWAAITRPVDAICLAAPVGIAVLLRARKLSPPRARVAALVPIAAGMVPFIALQFLFNLGVTGSIAKTPFQLYNDRDQPLLRFGFPQYDPDLPLKTTVAQKRIMYEQFVLPAAEQHTPARVPSKLAQDMIPLTLHVALPHPLLVILLPMGLMQAFRRRRYVLWASLPLFLLAYACYTLWLPHYPLPVAPAVILLMVLGLRALESAWPGGSGGATLAVLLLCLSALPQLDRRQDDNPIDRPVNDFSRRMLPTLVQRPAVVLFRFQPGMPGNDVHEEPVYNIDAARIDDAGIIRAHDLGPEKNRQLLAYYAEREPRRHVYVVDRADLSLKYLGTAGELVRRP